MADIEKEIEVDQREAVLRDMQRRQGEIWQALKDVGLWKSLSPRELAFAEGTGDSRSHQRLVDVSWRLSAAQALMWALGLYPDMPPYDEPPDPGLLRQIIDDGPQAFIKSAKLRAADEIDHARDVAEAWHWRSRTREIAEQDYPFPDELKAAGFRNFDDLVRMSATESAKDGWIPDCIDEDYPAMGKAYRDLDVDEWATVRSITVERHFALNWLCGYAPGNRWDETPTDT